ncbi:unnamed protein product [Phytomonas sp. Hart1]|nr:unnamed protein product [Phytomonas sp. Hart1]|eukprot:CCW70450.1 unnamed protein product [Phytomonas sp. isolate Hart1]
MNITVAETIRQQTDDLRDELKDLNQWVDKMAKLEESKKCRKTKPSSVKAEIPIRGTVPSIKQALVELARKEGKQLPPEQDPVHIQKEKGNEYFIVGKYKDAIDTYTAGIELDPKGIMAHVLYANRAMCWIKEKQWEKAEKDASACLQMNRSYAKGYFRRAISRKNLHDLKGARSDLESVLALVQNDTSALEELNTVTKMIQLEREKAAAPITTRKRITIEEVDDSDTESSERIKHSEEMQQKEQAKKNMEELERVIRNNERVRLETTLKLEKEMKAKCRQSTRVEIVEAEDKNSGACKPSEVVENSVRNVPDNSFHRTKYVDEKPGSLPPQVMNDVIKNNTSSDDHSDKLNGTVHLRRKLTKESLKTPKSFIEFEKVFSEIESDDELRNHFISSINPALFPSLFGSNMTPEIFIGLLSTIRQLPGSTALQYLKGLSRVNRIEDITLFLDTEEKNLVDDVLSLLRNGGVPEKEIIPIQRKLKPL